MKTLIRHESLSTDEKEMLRRCKRIISACDPTAEIILYGSRARGDAEAGSDYDLLILTDREATLESEDMMRRHLYPLELEEGTVLTVFLVSKAEWNSPLYGAMPFYQNVQKDGISL